MSHPLRSFSQLEVVQRGCLCGGACRHWVIWKWLPLSHHFLEMVGPVLQYVTEFPPWESRQSSEKWVAISRSSTIHKHGCIQWNWSSVVWCNSHRDEITSAADVHTDNANADHLVSEAILPSNDWRYRPRCFGRTGSAWRGSDDWSRSMSWCWASGLAVEMRSCQTLTHLAQPLLLDWAPWLCFICWKHAPLPFNPTSGMSHHESCIRRGGA